MHISSQASNNKTYDYPCFLHYFSWYFLKLFYPKNLHFLPVILNRQQILHCQMYNKGDVAIIVGGYMEGEKIGISICSAISHPHLGICILDVTYWKYQLTNIADNVTKFIKNEKYP